MGMPSGANYVLHTRGVIDDITRLKSMSTFGQFLSYGVEIDIVIICGSLAMS